MHPYMRASARGVPVSVPYKLLQVSIPEDDEGLSNTYRISMKKLTPDKFPNALACTVLRQLPFLPSQSPSNHSFC